MTGSAAAHLLVVPGKVYDASTAAGHMAVLSFDNGMCGTVADDVDPAALMSGLATGMKTQGVVVSTIGSAPDGHPQPYRLESATVHLALLVGMQTVNGHTQVSLLAMPDG